MPSKRRKMRFVFFILSISTTFKIDSALDQPENIFGNRSLRKCVDDEAFSSEKKSIVTTCANCCPNKKAKKKFCKKEFKYDGTKMEGKVWCPATCDNCSEETCQDNEDFTWKWKKGAIQYKNMTCKKLGDYLSITRKNICDSHDPKLDGEKTLVEEICPITCEACPSPAPSYTPSTAPPTMCQDNKDFKWKWKKGQITYGKLGCKKLGDYLSTTKKTICESHNPKFNGEKTLVEEICRETCGTCATPVPSHVPSSAPSAEPSLNPSDSHSVSPSALPSVLPSALPSIFPSARPSSIPSDEPSPEPSQLCTTQTLDGSNLESSGSGSFLAFDMKSLAQNTIQIEALEYRQIYQYGSFNIYTKQGSWTEATPINKSSESKVSCSKSFSIAILWNYFVANNFMCV
uniref:ShKT domain-containing protein n=2 Tax=Corethron hystrix TaxID=216773 RepID=A0A6U5LLF1_9STRA|mmetsp:Transcript_6039/g.12977  ORF Transcript_6039/g.12977 Transcript_6039/m.12977 type:complete len:402 (+) Transcript_6039:248-1453(+)